MFLRVLLILVLCLPTLSNAGYRPKLKRWKKVGNDYLHLNLNELRFTNRAGCAVDSKKPTASAFLLLNNVSVAKNLYRLAKSTDKDSSEFTKMGISVFRYSVLQLTQLIHRKLMNGELPLLPPDLESDNIPKEYRAVMENCRNGHFCKKLDTYLKGLWDISNSTKKNFDSVDDFYESHFFTSSKSFSNKDNKVLSCYYLKQFTPIQGHLFGTEPNRKLFSALGDTLKHSGKYLVDCSDIDAQENLKVATYQLDINNLDRSWDYIGFGYWNSMKLFVSWAWRNAEVMEKMAFPFANLFRGVDLEESVMFVPNGCKSITPPKCDHEYLSLNAIRELAKPEFKQKGLNLDILSSIPEGPQDDLLNDPFTPVNIDILKLSTHKGAQKWLENFRANVDGVRSIMRNKLISSTNLLNITTQKLSFEKLIKDLKVQFKGKLGGDDAEAILLKNQLYYLCSEASFVANKDYSFVRKKLELIKDTKFLEGLTQQISQGKISDFFVYYKQISEKINDICYSLKQKEIWTDDFTLVKDGYAPWYIDKAYLNKFESRFDELAGEAIGERKPYLAYKSTQSSKSDDAVICYSASHCIRKIIGSIVDIYSVTQYAYVFWDLDQKVSSPAMFNPYAERNTCKVYDPWFKTKAAIFGFVTDLGQIALSAFTPGYVFGSLRLKPGRVVSFRQLVKEGNIQYDTQMEKERIQMELITNFGPLLDVPCSVAISNANYNPYNYFQFSGITVGTCKNNAEHNLNVVNAEEMTNVTDVNKKSCISCSLKFASSGHIIGVGISKKLGPALTMLHALISLYKNFSDKFNIPRDWTVNLNYVLDTYRRYGKIPKMCVASLKWGEPCLDNTCAEVASELYHRKVAAPITHMRSTSGYTTYIRAKGCKKNIVVNTWQDASHDFESKSCTAMSIKIPDSCSKIRK